MEEIIKRIERMERLFDEVSAALDAGHAMDGQLREKIHALCAYMESGLWLADYRRDERGELPDGLKRGVISQDGLYNLLIDAKERKKER